MKKAVLSLFLALSFMLSAFVGVACGENTSSSSESSSESSMLQSESVTDSTESSVESLEESTTSSVESSVESADSSIEITGTPIEYTRIPFNGQISGWQTEQTPQIVTSKEELMILEEKFSWMGDPLSEYLSEDYFEDKAIVFYFYWRSYGGDIKQEVQNVFLKENILIIDFKETLLGDTIDWVAGCIVLCIEIEKEYVEKISEIELKVTS